MRIIATILAWLAFATSASGQLVIHGPAEVGSGEAFMLSIADAEARDLIRWRLLHPRGADIRQFDTKYGVECFIDPPASYRGQIEVECRIINWQKQRLLEDEVSVTVGKKVDPPPDDDEEDPVDPPPDDDPPPADKYDGPNEFGVGQISFDNAPEYSDVVSKILESAQGHLFGNPTVKVWFIDDRAANATDYNVNVWVANQLRAKIPTAGWNEWHAAVYKRVAELSRSGLTIQQQYDLFGEMRAGVEARKQ